jgi:hypothetical protein
MTVAGFPRGQDAQEKGKEEASRPPSASTLMERRYKTAH